MTLEEAFYSDISSVTNVTNLVGTRIYPLVLQQEDMFPAITYQRISTPRIYSLSGHTGLTTTRFQIDIIADSLAMAHTISELIRIRYSSFTRLMGGVSGVQIANIVLDDEQHFYDEVTKKRTIIIDLIINYYES